MKNLTSKYATCMNKENLERMIQHLKTIPEKLFNMKYYRDGCNFTVEEIDCTTPGCVIGHCILLSNETPKDSGGFINFASWSEEFTGLSIRSDSWHWCFSDNWVNIDNSIAGAIYRIQYLLDNDNPPENWIEEILENKETNYAN